MEILNAKLESKQKIHDMKMSKLEGRLEIKEKNAMIKIFGDEISNFEIKTNVKTIKNDEDKKQEEENEEVFEKIAEVAEIVDGDVQTIEAINPEEDKKKSAKKTTKKTSKKK